MSFIHFNERKIGFLSSFHCVLDPFYITFSVHIHCWTLIEREKKMNKSLQYIWLGYIVIYWMRASISQKVKKIIHGHFYIHMCGMHSKTHRRARMYRMMSRYFIHVFPSLSARNRIPPVLNI